MLKIINEKSAGRIFLLGLCDFVLIVEHSIQIRGKAWETFYLCVEFKIKRFVFRGDEYGSLATLLCKVVQKWCIIEYGHLSEVAQVKPAGQFWCVGVNIR